MMMRTTRVMRVLVFAVAALALLGARTARAEGSLDGKWSMSPMSESYNVKQWVGGCGPAPQSGNAGGGGTVRVVSEGDELTIMGGRVYKTNQCWDPMPTLVRDAHSRDPSGRRWSTRCSTPAGDPRRAVVTTTVVATSDTQIQIVETGRYEINLADGQCIADVRRASSLNLIERAGGAPSATATSTTSTATTATATSPTTPSSVDCSSPGEPARLEVRPSRKLMRSGESFTFKATVFDARGCSIATATTWKNLAPKMEAGRPSVDNAGTVTVDAATPEMSFDVEVSAAGKSVGAVRVSVEVTSASKYEDLLKQSGLNPEGERSDPAVVTLATGSIGGVDTRAEDGSRKRKGIFIAAVAALALILGAVALFGVRRSRRAALIERDAEERHVERMRDFEARKREREEKHAAAMRAHLESVKRAQDAAAAATAAELQAMGKMVCPSCRREYPVGCAFCSEDANRLIPLAGHEDVLTGPSGGICPACKRGFNPGVKVCPHDGEDLVPYAMAHARPEAAAPPRGKICPTCGGRFDGVAAFCGKDGTALVLLN